MTLVMVGHDHNEVLKPILDDCAQQTNKDIHRVATPQFSKRDQSSMSRGCSTRSSVQLYASYKMFRMKSHCINDRHGSLCRWSSFSISWQHLQRVLRLSSFSSLPSSPSLLFDELSLPLGV